MENLLLTVNETAEALGVSQSTIREMIREGGLPWLKVRRALRIPKPQLLAWIDGQVASRG